jgi:hypothetical protein
MTIRCRQMRNEALFCCSLLMPLLSTFLFGVVKGQAVPIKLWEKGVEYIGNAQFFPQRSFGPSGLRDAYEGPPRKMEWLQIAFQNNSISGLTIKRPDIDSFSVRADFQGFNDIYFEEVRVNYYWRARIYVDRSIGRLVSHIELHKNVE